MTGDVQYYTSYSDQFKNFVWPPLTAQALDYSVRVLLSIGTVMAASARHFKEKICTTLQPYTMPLPHGTVSVTKHSAQTFCNVKFTMRLLLEKSGQLLFVLLSAVRAIYCTV